jgi:hypothetical protein
MFISASGGRASGLGDERKGEWDTVTKFANLGSMGGASRHPLGEQQPIYVYTSASSYIISKVQQSNG